MRHGDGGPELAARIDAALRDVPDFPLPGVLFRDIIPLLADGPLFGAAVQALADLARRDGVPDLVAGVEARGFVLAGAVAGALGCGLVPVRKIGKLPPPTLNREYALEYGTATIEIPLGVFDGHRVLVVDDVLATGGTLRAAVDLVTEAGAVVTALGVLLEIVGLGGRARVAGPAPIHALLRV